MSREAQVRFCESPRGKLPRATLLFYHLTIEKKEEVYSEGFFLNSQLLTEGLADPM